MRCLLPLLLFPALLHAQSRSVTSGKVAYMSQDYEQAWTQLNRALGEPDQLEERHLVDAHHYRALMQITARLDDQEAFQRYKALLEP